jgi:hypothetical protein
MGARDDGPAFPRQQFRGSSFDDFDAGSEGMSLRDYFAAKALIGLFEFHGSGLLSEQEMAEAAYRFADAMLAEREKGGAS